MGRFIKIYQKDIVSNPERWVDSQPGNFVELPDRAKRLYLVLSVMSFSVADNASDVVLNNGEPLGIGWFWATPSLLQKLTGLSAINVHRAANDLVEDGFIEYHADPGMSDRMYFLVAGEKRIDAGTSSGGGSSEVSPQTGQNALEDTQEDWMPTIPMSWPGDIWDLDPMAEIVKEKCGENAYIVYRMDSHSYNKTNITKIQSERFKSFSESELATIRKEMYSRTEIPEIFEQREKERLGNTTDDS